MRPWLRGACGATNADSCTLDARSLSRHLHVTPGAQVYVSNLRLVNGSAMNPACDALKQVASGMVPGSAATCTPAYFNYGVYIGLLGNFPGLAEELNYPALGDEVTAEHLATLQAYGGTGVPIETLIAFLIVVDLSVVGGAILLEARTYTRPLFSST